MTDEFSRRTQFSILIGTTAIQAVATAATLAFPVLLPAIPGATPYDLGLYMAVLYLGAILGATCSGAAIQRLGPILSSQTTLLLQCLGIGLVALGEDVPRLMGALILGVAYGPITPASSQVLSRTTPPHRMSLVFSVKQTGVPLGGLLAGALLVPLASATSWQMSLAALVALALLVVLVSHPLHRLLDQPQKDITPTHTGPLASLGLVLRDRPLRALALVSLLFSVCQLSLGAYLVIYLTEEVGLSLVDAGLVYAATQAGGIAGRIFWGRVADAVGKPNAVLAVLAVLLLIAAAATASMDSAWPMALIVLVTTVFGATAIGWNGVFLGLVAKLSPAGGVASITGGVLAFTYLGVVVGPPLFALIGQSFGTLAAGFVSLAGVALVTLGVLWRMRGA